MTIGPQGIGASVLRKEDRKFLIGRGRYVADMAIPGALYCRIVRPVHAHAELRGIDVSAARAVPGVVAVLTGADMAADGLGPMTPLWAVPGKDGKPMAEPPRWALARGKVRHVGEAIAAVIAETPEAATDGAEAVAVGYDPLPAAIGSRAAAAPVLHDEAPGNACFIWERGDAQAVDAAIAAAAHVVRIEIYNNRLTGTASDPLEDTITLHANTQVAHMVRRLVASQLGIDEARIRVVSPDVGGGFGYKASTIPRRPSSPGRRAGSAARCAGLRTGRGVRLRSSGARSPDQRQARGRRLSRFARSHPRRSRRLQLDRRRGHPERDLHGPAGGCLQDPDDPRPVTGVFTNTTPTDAYRGAGWPEAGYVLERLADKAAAATGLERTEIRRRNPIPASVMPYATPIGPTCDCGDFPRIMARALAASDYDGFGPAPGRSERPAARHRHCQLRRVFRRCALAPAGHLRRTARDVRIRRTPRRPPGQSARAARHA